MFDSIHKKVVEKFADLKDVRGKHKDEVIVTCSGCFDVLQTGHPVFFNQCKGFGDVLVVSVGSDAVIRKLKGPERPINPEVNRVHMVAAFEDVDYAVLGAQEVGEDKIDFKDMLENLRPDIFILNDDDSAIEPKRALCESLSVELRLVKREVPDYLEPTSTTQVVEHIKQLA